jgi:hypothetical protein
LIRLGQTSNILGRTNLIFGQQLVGKMPVISKTLIFQIVMGSMQSNCGSQLYRHLGRNSIAINTFRVEICLNVNTWVFVSTETFCHNKKSINSFSDNHAHSYTEQQYTADKRCLQAGDNYFH